MNKILTSKKFWIFVVILFVLGGIATAIDNTKPASDQGVASQHVQVSPTDEKYNYQVLSRQDNKTVENIAVLISAGNTNAEAIAMEVKKTCKKPCNIDVYDDQKAYDLNAQYDKMMGESTTQPDDLTTWKKANYVYVGDHLVGSVDFETGTFNDYPFRDWYYKELKGEK